MRNLAKTLGATLLKDESGAAAAEYAVLLVLITGAMITAVTLLGTNISAVFNSVANVIKPLAA